MKNIYKRYTTIIASILFLSVIWEFWIEGFFQIGAEPESFDQRVEYVLTVFAFAVMALIGPFFSSKRSEIIRTKLESGRDDLIYELQESLQAIKRLEGVVPICADCKKIRDGNGAWSQLEAYISDHSEAQFSHGICPDCFEVTLAELQ